MKITIENFRHLKIKSEDKLKEYLSLCIKENKKEKIKYQTELHHILPNALFPKFSNLKNNPWNGAHLLYKDHYIAHTLLAEALEEHSAIIAWWCMNSLGKRATHTNNSKLLLDAERYDLLKNKACISLSEYKKGTVNVKDVSTGKNIIVTSKEFQDNSNYITHTKGKVTVFDVELGMNRLVTSKEYRENINLISLSKNKVNAIDITTGKRNRVSREEYRTNDNLVFNILGDIPVFDKETNQRRRVTKEEYENNTNLVSLSYDKVNAIDITTNVWAKVTKEEYRKNKKLFNRKDQKKYLVDNIPMRKIDAETYIESIGYKSTFGNFLKLNNKNKYINSFREIGLDEYITIIKDNNETISSSRF